jgi:hypothetical protein
MELFDSTAIFCNWSNTGFGILTASLNLTVVSFVAARVLGRCFLAPTVTLILLLRYRANGQDPTFVQSPILG